jgi:hypothetical protein
LKKKTSMKLRRPGVSIRQIHNYSLWTWNLDFRYDLVLTIFIFNTKKIDAWMLLYMLSNLNSLVMIIQGLGWTYGLGWWWCTHFSFFKKIVWAKSKAPTSMFLGPGLNNTTFKPYYLGLAWKWATWIFFFSNHLKNYLGLDRVSHKFLDMNSNVELWLVKFSTKSHSTQLAYKLLMWCHISLPTTIFCQTLKGTCISHQSLMSDQTLH